MNELLKFILPELGVPAAVLIVGIALYVMESRKREKPKIVIEENTDLKLWFIQHVKDPITEEIRRISNG